MSDSSDDESIFDEAFKRTKRIFYRDRNEWRDVVPVPQDDGPEPIVSIPYSEKFKDAFDYFRAVLKSGEKSQRALELTLDCANLNPANYTVWTYRREILKALGSDLEKELKCINFLMKKNSKNYQLWHHRQVIVELLKDPSYELEFTAMILKLDAKNYHAWQHRQWVIRTFNLYDKEIEYVEELLLEDVRNNSAWNQRYFVLDNTTKFEPEIIDREIDFAISKIHIVKGNESPWSYLKGILMNDHKGLGYNEKVMKLCQQLYSEGCRVNHLLACIIDICQERHKEKDPPDSLFHVDNALKLCVDLADKYDVIRKKYWEFISDQLKESFNECSTTV